MGTMTIAIYPGSFDPLTNGHLDLIHRGARLFDRLLVAVGVNPGKQTIFELQQRMDLVQGCIGEVEGVVEVVSFTGLLVDAAKEHGATCVIRGVRGASDLDSESSMANTNRTLLPELDTVFFSPAPEWSFLSSRLVREIARGHGEVNKLVPPAVAQALQQRFPD